MSSPTVLTVDDRTTAARVLAHAFRDDPVTTWLTRGDRARLRRVLALYLRSVYTHPGSVDIAWADGRAVGAAVWDPARAAFPVGRFAVSVPAWVATLGPALPRGIRLLTAAKDAAPKEPMPYLAAVGAAEQGRGIGTALLRHRLDAYDGPAYLESSNIRNIPLYERFGFEVTGELAVPGAPPQWTMQRR